jgi:undecaprenyl-diphosphatase
MDWLLAQDHALLLAINGAHSEIVDTFMSVVSDKLTWLPLYAALLVLLYRQVGWQRLLMLIGVLALVILMSDQVASGLLKPLVQRPRPCHLEGFRQFIHLADKHCGGAYGFASSHAANFFALATFMVPFFWKRFRFLVVGLFLVAGLVGYSRIYLGVHYPSDVLAGMLIGMMAGWLGIFLFKTLAKRFVFPQPSSN